MPLLNEERHLEEAVGAVVAQRYPGEMQIVLAVGPGHDDTLGVAERLAERDPRITVVENPSGRTPEALNLAVASAAHDIIVRVDGHGFLSDGYIERAVRVLEETGAANVGGVMLAEGVTDLERAVAVAMTSPLGVGGARFHTGGHPGPADTVYLGVFRREWLDAAGGYDPRFTRAQDWELNYRIRQAGGVVWFDPALTVKYRPRPTLRALSRQYRDYGRWRRVVATRHKGSINARYLAAPTALVAVAVGLVGGLVWRPLWAVPAAYAAGVGIGGVAIARHEAPGVAVRVPGVLATMHGSWGWGFLTSRPEELVPEEEEAW
jgi:glycosyltransferase involved in cell wall biosynthesis